jgi:hypothetical protein
VVVVEKLLFGEIEHKVEIFPFAVHRALLSCESIEVEGEREREREEGGGREVKLRDQERVGSHS